MRLIWDIEYDYEDCNVIGVREGLKSWLLEHGLHRSSLAASLEDEEWRIYDVAGSIEHLDPDLTKFTTFMMTPGARWKVTDAREIQWLEDDLMPRMLSADLWSDWKWVD